MSRLLRGKATALGVTLFVLGALPERVAARGTDTADEAWRNAGSASDIAVKLWMAGCVQNGGDATKVRSWAEGQKLAEITDAKQLQGFVGVGAGGAAWAVPTRLGNFAILTRATTKGCVVYAQKADPTDVKRYFAAIIDGVRRSGLSVAMFEDEDRP